MSIPNKPIEAYSSEEWEALVECAKDASDQVLDLVERLVEIDDDHTNPQAAAYVLLAAAGRISGRFGNPEMTARQAWELWTNEGFRSAFDVGWREERAATSGTWSKPQSEPN